VAPSFFGISRQGGLPHRYVKRQTVPHCLSCSAIAITVPQIPLHRNTVRLARNRAISDTSCTRIPFFLGILRSELSNRTSRRLSCSVQTSRTSPGSKCTCPCFRKYSGPSCRLPAPYLRPNSRLTLNLECSSTRCSNHTPETQGKSDSYSLVARTPRH
jgi:hypothetical protein